MATCVKSARHRLYVVHMPSLSEFAWRQAFTDAAAHAGWAVMEDHGQSPDLQTLTTDVLIKGSDPKRATAWQPTEILLIIGAPNSAIDAVMEQSDTDFGDAARYVAARFAAANDLVAEGLATVSAATDGAISARGLGSVRPASSLPEAIRADGPLSFYGGLPPRPGSSAVWPQSLFTLNPTDHGDAVDGLDTDLTGRRRVLQHGPYVTLTPGAWEARVQFAVAVNSSAIDLRFEWGHGHEVDVSTHSITASGIYEVVLVKEWAEAQPVELRVWLDRAIFDGGFEIKRCTVRFIGLGAAVESNYQAGAAATA